MAKKQYRVRNWVKYNESLVQRGSITFWLDEEVIREWYTLQEEHPRGRPQLYSDIAIECALTLRALFKLPLRATEGLIKSILELAHLPLQAPDYTTLCKRQRTLEIEIPRYSNKSDKGLHIVIDSTGLKVFGEGEWKVRQHGVSKRRTWRKLQIALDANSQEIISCMLTSNDCHDKEVLQELIEEIEEPIGIIGGDGGYESHANYTYLRERDIKALIPPRKDACIKQHGNSRNTPLARDEVIRQMRMVGRKRWKQQSGYHQRSLVETAMFRLKTLFGDGLSNRLFEHQVY